MAPFYKGVVQKEYLDSINKWLAQNRLFGGFGS
jgi:hypothetical protein